MACDGSTYNRADYPALANHLVTDFSDLVGDGSTTFKVPDLRGEFLRGTGTNGHSGQGSGAAVGAHQDATEIPMVTFSSKGKTDSNIAFVGNKSATVQCLNADTNGTQGSGSLVVWVNSTQSMSTTRNYTYTARSTNTSILYCIKY